MKFERQPHLGKYDWYFQIGDTSGRKAFCILLKHYTGDGFGLRINLCHDWLIKLFGFNEKIIGV